MNINIILTHSQNPECCANDVVVLASKGETNQHTALITNIISNITKSGKCKQYCSVLIP